MKKLKILLLFSLIFIFLFRLQIKYNYNPNDNYVIGKVIDYKVKENYTIINLNEIIEYYYDEFKYKKGYCRQKRTD